MHDAIRASKDPHDFEGKLLECSKKNYPDYYVDVFSIIVTILSKDCNEYGITMRESAIRVYGLPERKEDVAEIKAEKAEYVKYEDDVKSDEEEEKGEIHITDLSGIPPEKLPADVKMKIENIMTAKKSIPPLEIEDLYVDKDAEDRFVWMRRGRPAEESEEESGRADKKIKKKGKKKKKKKKKKKEKKGDGKNAQGS